MDIFPQFFSNSFAAFSHDTQELYQTGGLGGTSGWGGHWEVNSLDLAYKLKLSNSTTNTDLEVEKLTESYLYNLWGKDSHSMVVHNNYLYKIGGYSHSSMTGQQYDVNCGYDSEYKYFASAWGEVKAMPLTGINATVGWDYYPSLVLAVGMACTVSVNDEYIYVIGGFSEARKTDQFLNVDFKLKHLKFIVAFQSVKLMRCNILMILNGNSRIKNWLFLSLLTDVL